MLNIFNVERDLIEKIYKSAEEFSKFRKKCKEFLKHHNKHHDKFTAVSHDDFIGYVAEKTVLQVLQKLNQNPDISITHWEEQYDMGLLQDILISEKPSQEEINTVNSYFHDKYDIQLSKDQTRLDIDVKSALTAKAISSHWCFYYPVSQAKAPNINKKCVVLAYYTTKIPQDHNTLMSVDIPGYALLEDIVQCQVVKKGGTGITNIQAQVDNYDTPITMYKHIEQIFQLF